MNLIELLLGISPDNGNGSIELLTVLAILMAVLVAIRFRSRRSLGH